MKVQKSGLKKNLYGIVRGLVRAACGIMLAAAVLSGTAMLSWLWSM